MTIDIHSTAIISKDARIYPSQKKTIIRIGAYSEIYDFVVIKPVGGMGDITIGEHCYINAHCTLYSGHGITFGDYVLLAPGVVVAGSNHAYSSLECEIRKQGFAPSKGGVVIENNVWIGANSVILDGAYIETGAVIAAGSVVRGRVGANEVWGGVPAKLIKRRLSND
ncbi:lipopolysaccharide O-acetyltransferase [Methylophilaceae bacterium]|nr:lipopolysaccharide O-acetyltransferase [Methylophilaceae bacterium]